MVKAACIRITTKKNAEKENKQGKKIAAEKCERAASSECAKAEVMFEENEKKKSWKTSHRIESTCEFAFVSKYSHSFEMVRREEPFICFENITASDLFRKLSVLKTERKIFTVNSIVGILIENSLAGLNICFSSFQKLSFSSCMRWKHFRIHNHNLITFVDLTHAHCLCVFFLLWSP